MSVPMKIQTLSKWVRINQTMLRNVEVMKFACSKRLQPLLKTLNY
jgi:hypothetical protein